MKTTFLHKALLLLMLSFSLLSCKENIKLAESLKLNSEITTAYSNLYAKENRNHTNFKNTDKAKDEA